MYKRQILGKVHYINPGNALFDALIDCAVSYTHLDVYKRQAVDFPPCKCMLVSNDEEALIVLEDHWRRQLNGTLDVFRSELYFLEVVPDVYKRQVHIQPFQSTKQCKSECSDK